MNNLNRTNIKYRNILSLLRSRLFIKSRFSSKILSRRSRINRFRKNLKQSREVRNNNLFIRSRRMFIHRKISQSSLNKSQFNFKRKRKRKSILANNQICLKVTLINNI